MQNNELDQFVFFLNNNNDYLPSSSNQNQDSTFNHNYNYYSVNPIPDDFNYHVNDNQFNMQSPIDSLLDQKNDNVTNQETSKLSPFFDVKPIEKEVTQIKPTRKKKITRKKESTKQAKPVSAYAHFFREKQISIKKSNPEVSFGEVSKIVAAEWDSLSKEAKAVYKHKAHLEKSEYLKQLATFKANAVAGQLGIESMVFNSNHNELLNNNNSFKKEVDQSNLTSWSSSFQSGEDWSLISSPNTFTNYEASTLNNNQMQNTHSYQPANVSVDFNYHQQNLDYSANHSSFDCNKNFFNYAFKPWN